MPRGLGVQSITSCFFFQTSLSVSNFAAVIKREMMASISANQEFWQAGVSCGGERLSAAQQMREGGSGEGGGCYLLWTLLWVGVVWLIVLQSVPLLPWCCFDPGYFTGSARHWKHSAVEAHTCAEIPSLFRRDLSEVASSSALPLVSSHMALGVPRRRRGSDACERI